MSAQEGPAARRATSPEAWRLARVPPNMGYPRKHLPVQDVMAAAGWRDVNALQKAYQAADPQTVRRVMR